MDDASSNDSASNASSEAQNRVERDADISSNGHNDRSRQAESDDEGVIASDAEVVSESRKKGRLRKEAEEYRERLARRGVVYMSRIPPYMKPNKAKNLFQHYGEVTRIYLAEEDILQRKKRKEHGGNASKQFVEGWVEFADKKVAKQVAASLNNTRIGGKKGSFYHDDVWNLKYLKHFKWDYLTEKMAYEKRVKEMKLRAAMMAAKQSNAEIAEQVEQGKVQQHIAERKRQKRDHSALDNSSSASSSAHNCSNSVDHSSSSSSSNSGGVDSGGDRLIISGAMKRTFRQQKAVATSYGEKERKATTALLQKVFATSSK